MEEIVIPDQEFIRNINSYKNRPFTIIYSNDVEQGPFTLKDLRMARAFTNESNVSNFYIDYNNGLRDITRAIPKKENGTFTKIKFEDFGLAPAVGTGLRYRSRFRGKSRGKSRGRSRGKSRGRR